MRTSKKKERSLELSKQNELLQSVFVRGIEFKIIGTFRNTNGTWSHRILNTSMNRKQDRIKTIGDIKLQQIIKQYSNENKHLL